MPKQTKPTRQKSQPITEELLDQKLEEFSNEVVQDISDHFSEKFAENEARWRENEVRWRENEHEHEELNKKLDRIANTQDKILQKFETWEQENTVGANQIHELRVDVANHERRLKKLETAKN